jgi:5-methylcytosine-specific restriction endonuclease McrA
MALKPKVLENVRRWQIKNQHKIAAYRYHRRGLKNGATAHAKKLIEKFIRLIKALDFVRCYYCLKVIAGTIHFDHIVPIAKQGPHSIENICVACASCNCSKSDKLIHEWITAGQLLFSL